MNQEQKTKVATIKTLAIIGLFATVVLSVWILIQVVRVIPDTFTSLASIAESIQQYSPATELTITTEKNILNSGEALNVTWSDLGQDGAYHFSYSCTPGISANIQASGGEIVTLSCDDMLTLGTDIQDLNVIFVSSERRFIDVPFSISFSSAEGEVLSQVASKVTLVNAAIPQGAELAAADDTAREEPATEVMEAGVPTEDTPAAKGSGVAAVEEPAKPTTPEETATESVISFIPQSHEDGFTDLKTNYLGIGALEDGVFVAQATFDENDRGAFKFEVKNIGTKTSDEWTFTATLPSGYIYESDEQVPLRPNERVEFTLGFGVNESPQVSTVGATVSEPTDTNIANNSFTWAVEITE